MKVAVITRHAITNYGSLLQTLATQHIIEKMGFECEIIDYIRKDEHYYNYEKNLLKYKNEWKNANLVKKMIYLAIRIPETIISGKKFEKARQHYLNLTRRYNSVDELKSQKPIADVYVTGSDQVWGGVIDGSNDEAYWLTFLNQEDKKVSYAASFGKSKLDKGNKEQILKWLLKYKYITVREDNAVDMLRDLGLKSERVLDPTLLVEKSMWFKYLLPIKEKGYVLVYQLHNDKRLGEYANKVAKLKGLPLIRISPTFHQISRQGKFVWLPEFGEFLSYIKNAECMITDSFHGTAFAITFNTPFIEVLPNNNTKGRNISILKLTGLESQLLDNFENFDLALKKVDFSYANKILSNERNNSYQLFKDIIRK